MPYTANKPRGLVYPDKCQLAKKILCHARAYKSGISALYRLHSHSAMSSNEVDSKPCTLEFLIDKHQRMQLAYRPELDSRSRGWYMQEYSIPLVDSLDCKTFQWIFEKSMVLAKEPHEIWDSGNGIVVTTNPSFPKPMNISVLWHTLYSCVPLKYFPPSSEHAGKEPPQALADTCCSAPFPVPDDGAIFLSLGLGMLQEFRVAKTPPSKVKSHSRQARFDGRWLFTDSYPSNGTVPRIAWIGGDMELGTVRRFEFPGTLEATVCVIFQRSLSLREHLSDGVDECKKKKHFVLRDFLTATRDARTICRWKMAIWKVGRNILLLVAAIFLAFHHIKMRREGNESSNGSSLTSLFLSTQACRGVLMFEHGAGGTCSPGLHGFCRLRYPVIGKQNMSSVFISFPRSVKAAHALEMGRTLEHMCIWTGALYIVKILRCDPPSDLRLEALGCLTVSYLNWRSYLQLRSQLCMTHCFKRQNNPVRLGFWKIRLLLLNRELRSRSGSQLMLVPIASKKDKTWPDKYGFLLDNFIPPDSSIRRHTGPGSPLP
ncbi:hypothetical protein EV421DRAFT_1932333 [Armillaria borealis]|uniref:Uncharacterized protein n=1 Tax=Armillaria borealis TaxID=47425 RepID=A0AA39IVU5_9AGAR|nr:hypothetical protein EV421DRAFT_1932333 [Armillaria borealis]